MQDDIRVDDQPVTLMFIESRMLGESDPRQYRSVSRELRALVARFITAWNVIADISLPQDCESSSVPIDQVAASGSWYCSIE
jgi:hypothetical protein